MEGDHEPNPLFHDWEHNACAPSKPLGQWSQSVKAAAAQHAEEDERLGKETRRWSSTLKRFRNMVEGDDDS